MFKLNKKKYFPEEMKQIISYNEIKYYYLSLLKQVSYMKYVLENCGKQFSKINLIKTLAFGLIDYLSLCCPFTVPVKTI